MRTATSTYDESILPRQARQELHDFYDFLVSKYVKKQKQPAGKNISTVGTAGALASSPLVGIWKDRNLDDSVTYARSLRNQSQKRTLS